MAQTDISNDNGGDLKIQLYEFTVVLRCCP